MASAPNPPDTFGRFAPLVPIAAVAVAVVAVVARFTTASPLWLDEALSVHIASLPVGEIPEALRHDGHPPLYYLLLHGWIGVFGTGDVAVRSLSGVLGVVSLPLAWLAGRRVGGPAVGWGTAAFVALCPYAVRYATETRMYSLVMVLVLAGWLLVRRAVDEGSVRPVELGGLAVVTGALLLTHYWGLYLVAATAVVLLARARPVAVRLVGAMAVGSLAFLVWVPSLLEQAAHTGTPWSPAARPTVVVDQTLTDLAGNTYRAETGVLAALLAVAFVVGAFGRAGASGRSIELELRPAPAVAGELAVLALTLGLGTAVGIVTQTAFASRYAAVVVPLLAVLAGRALALVPRPVPVVVVGVVLAGLASMGILGNVIDDRTQALDLAAAVAAHGDVARGDVVVVCPDQLGPSLRRALDQAGLEAMPVLAYPALGDGRFVDWYDYEARNDAADPVAVAGEVVARLAPGARVFVAWSGAYRTFEGDCEAVLGQLAQAVGPPQSLVADGGTEFFEHAALLLYVPAS